ncbi:MAG: hypothetical protein NTY30_02010 [Candidatus Berkelbacteria bacterium]|nr:hypothetical protein [Candidatus Berkelbacteria bacterium]
MRDGSSELSRGNYGQDVDLTDSSILRDFSKEKYSTQRRETASNIVESRQAKREKEAKLNELLKTNAGLAELDKKLQDLKQNFWSRWANCLQIARTRREINQLGEKGEQLQEDIDSTSEIEEASTILENFYKNMRSEWEADGIPEEEMVNAFSEENLSSLNLTDYTLLLGKSRSELATHVTRQGVRDHTTIWEHTAGLNEYHDGFVNIIRDGRIRSVVGSIYRDGKLMEDIDEYLEYYLEHNHSIPELSQDQENLKRYYLFSRLTQKSAMAEAMSFEDRASVHFGLREVLDRYYGSESGNEIFFAVPVAHFLADHQISQANLDNQNQSAHNDLWIYTKDCDGISVNTSIAFIPRSTIVDRTSGSTYDLSQRSEDGTYQKVSSPDNSCTSMEYWESYFQQNPQLKPKRVIYYDGEPSSFLASWEKQNGLKLSTNSLPRRQIDESGLIEDYERYSIIISKAINEKYPMPEVVSAALSSLVDSCDQNRDVILKLAERYPKLFKGPDHIDQFCYYIKQYLNQRADNSDIENIYDFIPDDLRVAMDHIISVSPDSAEINDLSSIIQYDLPTIKDCTSRASDSK